MILLNWCVTCRYLLVLGHLVTPHQNVVFVLVRCQQSLLTFVVVVVWLLLWISFHVVSLPYELQDDLWGIRNLDPHIYHIFCSRIHVHVGWVDRWTLRWWLAYTGALDMDTFDEYIVSTTHISMNCTQIRPVCADCVVCCFITIRTSSWPMTCWTRLWSTGSFRDHIDWRDGRRRRSLGHGWIVWNVLHKYIEQGSGLELAPCFHARRCRPSVASRTSTAVVQDTLFYRYAWSCPWNMHFLVPHSLLLPSFKFSSCTHSSNMVTRRVQQLLTRRKYWLRQCRTARRHLGCLSIYVGPAQASRLCGFTRLC